MLTVCSGGGGFGGYFNLSWQIHTEDCKGKNDLIERLEEARIYRITLYIRSTYLHIVLYTFYTYFISSLFTTSRRNNLQK